VLRKVRKWIPKWQENLDPWKSKFAAHMQADTEIAKKGVGLK
jgi:asparagine synthase (glutamine-hydrolysing)